jgi:hypothetical protein
MLDRLGISALIGAALLIGAIDLHSQAPATPRAVADGLELTIDAVHDAFRSHRACASAVTSSVAVAVV